MDYRTNIVLSVQGSIQQHVRKISSAASELFKDTPPTLKKAPSTKSYLRWIFYATKKSSFISLSTTDFALESNS